MKEDIACAEILLSKRCLFSWVLARKVAPIIGYDYDLINSRIDMIDSVNDEDNFIKKKEQIIKKLSSKYSGYELERKVKEKLYRLGYFK